MLNTTAGSFFWVRFSWNYACDQFSVFRQFGVVTYRNEPMSLVDDFCFNPNPGYGCNLQCNQMLVHEANQLLRCLILEADYSLVHHLLVFCFD